MNMVIKPFCLAYNKIADSTGYQCEFIDSVSDDFSVIWWQGGLPCLVAVERATAMSA